MARKDAGISRVANIYEILFYLRKNYSTRTEDRARIDDIPQDDRFSFKETSDYLKAFSKSVIEIENITLKNKVLLGDGYQQRLKCLDAIKCVEKNLPNRFEEWMLREYGIKKHTIYNYKNLYKLMIIAPKVIQLSS